MDVLVRFQSQSSSEKAARSPPRKWGKGGVLDGTPREGQSSLASSLLQMLHSAIQNSWSDQDLIQRMTTKLSKFSGNESNSDSESSPKQQRSVTFVDNNFPPLPGRKDSPVGAPKSILKFPGSPNSPQNKGNPKHSPSGSRQLEEWFHGSQSNDRSESASPKRKRARFAVKINKEFLLSGTKSPSSKRLRWAMDQHLELLRLFTCCRLRLPDKSPFVC